MNAYVILDFYKKKPESRNEKREIAKPQRKKSVKSWNWEIAKLGNRETAKPPRNHRETTAKR